MGRKGKLVRTNKARTLSETGKQVSGPKHYYTLKRNNSIVQLRTKSINVITKQSSSRGPQNIASTSRPEDSEFTTLYKRATKSIAEEISVDTIPEETTGYTYCQFLSQLQKLVDERKTTDIPFSDIKKEIAINPEEIHKFITKMINERKNVCIYKDQNEDEILRVMIKSTFCKACSTTSSKCRNCGKPVCDMHSDAEINQSNRTCDTCQGN